MFGDRGSAGRIPRTNSVTVQRLVVINIITMASVVGTIVIVIFYHLRICSSLGAQAAIS